MIVFKKKTDRESGVDLYQMYRTTLADGRVEISQELDPWTTTTVKGIFNRIGVEWKDED